MSPPAPVDTAAADATAPDAPRGPDSLFEALAEPTRRAAVASLMARPHSSTELARAIGVTPQALTRHLRVLRRSGLVRADGDAADARLRVYRIAPAALAPLGDWLAAAERLWTVQLAAFADHAERRGE